MVSGLEMLSKFKVKLAALEKGKKNILNKDKAVCSLHLLQLFC